MELGKHAPSLLRAHCYVFIIMFLVVEEEGGLSYKVGEDFAGPGKQRNLTGRKVTSILKKPVQLLSLRPGFKPWLLTIWLNKFIH